MTEHYDQGITKKEGVYFQSTSEFAKKHLYCLLWGAVYQCNSKYSYKRDYLDAFIFFHIKEGTLSFQYRNQEFTACAGDSVILDCKYPNYYWASDTVTFYWFHFSGSETQAFCDLFFENGKYVFSSYYQTFVAAQVKSILNQLQEKELNEFFSSSLIYNLLCHFASNPSSKTTSADILIKNAISYMEEHILEPITVHEISNFVGLSLYYFTRTFKKQIGITPHDYLLSLRITKAKEHLTNTTYSIEETAIRSGFFSTSHFIHAFKKSTGYTPKQFRQIF